LPKLVEPRAIYLVRENIEIIKKVLPQTLSLSFVFKPAAEGQTSPEKTDRGYELRIQGPATLGPEVLDNLRLKREIRVNFKQNFEVVNDFK